ncbi:hypothetical protein EVAR_10435_1 [Eumeta japonica]|uniref:Uncharacterized protein n=1 Tax=Eumeta variegata TaxID=151549 RepID=A0A4C1UCV4_EUMVA|nr:hypothetical protein EVAR_10435_1 [Eumeta japonica]
MFYLTPRRAAGLVRSMGVSSNDILTYWSRRVETESGVARTTGPSAWTSPRLPRHRDPRLQYSALDAIVSGSSQDRRRNRNDIADTKYQRRAQTDRTAGAANYDPVKTRDRSKLSGAAGS